MSSGLESFIYHNTSAGMLIGRAWHLFRLNMKTALLLMLLPAVLFALQGVFASIPSALAATASVGMPQLMLALASIVGTVFIGLAASVTALFLSLVLTRIFWSSLLGKQPISLAESLAFFKRPKIIGALILLAIVTFGLYMICLAVDLAIFLLGMGIAAQVFTTAMQQMQQSGISNAFTIGGISVVYLIITGFVVMGVVLALLGIQILLLNMPFIAIATGTGEQLSKDIGKSLRLLAANLPKAVLFGIMLIVFVFIAYSVLTLPLISIWAPFEMQRIQAEGSQLPGMLPYHVTVAINFWTSILTALSLPYIFAAMTLFWYDCRTHGEGIDLRLWLRTLRLRQGMVPEEGTEGKDFI